MNKDLKLQVLRRDKFKCQRCGHTLYYLKVNKKKGKRAAHIHHVIHKEHGGTDDINNLMSTCWKCEKAHHKRN